MVGGKREAELSKGKRKFRGQQSCPVHCGVIARLPKLTKQLGTGGLNL
jgi:hypothetical protein